MAQTPADIHVPSFSFSRRSLWIFPLETEIMDSCYYCGRQADYECDAWVPENRYCHCGRSVCDQHAVPEFQDGNVGDFTLCKDHAHLQVPRKPKS